LGNIPLDDEYGDIEPYVAEQQNNQITGKEILSGLLGLAKAGMEKMTAENNKKIEKIERLKEHFQNKSTDELRQIIMTSSSFEEIVAAKKLLQEMEG
jgi:Cft2 family RNA processing exonuclease